MNKDRGMQATRRAYHKPQLEQVQLSLEEAVLGGCKGQVVAAGPLAQYGGANCEAGSAQCFLIQS